MAASKLKQLGVGRRQPDDPLFTTGDALCRMFVREGIINIDDEQLCHQVVPVFPCDAPGCKESFASLLDFEMHYNSQHRFICKECRKPMPTAHLLDLHISETHDSFFAALAQRKPMYRCYVEECLVMCQDETQRKAHCIEVHNFPHDFRYGVPSKKNKKSTHKGQNTIKSQDCEAMLVDEVQENKPQNFKQFTFGHNRKSKTFSKMNPWHAQGKKNKKKDDPTSENSTITTSELMEALPS